jgi:glycosyltransferase involved in cell wall biosynthesis
VQPAVRVAYVIRSWPRLSQTFVLNEVLALERRGVDISIFALTRANERLVQPQVADVAAPLRYLDDAAQRRLPPHLRVLAAAPLRYLATLLFALTRRRLFGGYTQSGAAEAFAKAVLVADRLQAAPRSNPFTHIHAHFAHDPALIGLLAHRLTGLPFSFTAHARDLYQIPDAALIERIREAVAVVTCCRANVEHITHVAGAAKPIELIYHGLDLQMFRPATNAQIDNGVPSMIAVGRLVEKKGFDDLLRACAVLTRRGRAFRCDIYGEGPCRRELEDMIDQLRLGGVVSFHEPVTQAELVDVYQHADVFALTPRVTPDGDRDGIPNALVEAMACGVPVVSTRVGGISELVTHGSDGLMAPPGDVDAIATCLTELLDDGERRRRLGAAAAKTAARFDSQSAALKLSGLFSNLRGGAP